MNTALINALNAIQSDLEGIDGVSPYTTDVELVSQDLALIGENTAFPAIFIALDGEEAVTQLDLARLYYTANLTLFAFLDTATQDTSASVQLQKFVGDIQYAMIAPTKVTHSSTVYYTRYLGQEPLPVSGRPIQGAQVRFSFEYGFAATIATN